MTLTDLKEAEKVIKGQQDNKDTVSEPAKTQEEETSKDNQIKPRSSRATSDDVVRGLGGTTRIITQFLY